MDRLDREILGILQEDARISYRDLGVRVGLSANAAGDRVRRMRRDGVIRGFTVIVDPAADTRSGLVVFIDVSLRLDTTNEEFERSVLTLPGITEVVHVTGGHDYLVRATAADPGSLDTLLRPAEEGRGRRPLQHPDRPQSGACQMTVGDRPPSSVCPSSATASRTAGRPSDSRAVASTSTSTADTPALRCAAARAPRSTSSSSPSTGSLTRASTAPVNCTDGWKPSTAAAPPVSRRTRPRKVVGASAGGCWSAKIAVLTSWMVESSSSTACPSSSAVVVSLGQVLAPRRLQHHLGREQPLDDEVVQIAGDAVAVLVDGQLLPVVLRVGHHERQRRLRGELGGELPVRRRVRGLAAPAGKGERADEAGRHSATAASCWGRTGSVRGSSSGRPWPSRR